MHRLLAIAILACALALPAGAQPASPAAAATAVADSLFRAAAAGRWRDAARLLDLARFEVMLRDRIGNARSAVRPPPITAEQIMESDPDMPREVAEYQARKLRESSTQDGDWLAYEFADVSHVDTLAALTVEAAAARWIEAQDVRYHLRRSIESARVRGCEVPIDAFPLPAERPRVIVGAVVRDAAAFVLHEELRASAAEPGPPGMPPSDAWWAEPPAVLVLRRVGSAWRVVPTARGLLDGSSVRGFVVSSDCPRRR